ncbi:sialic acid synthase [Shewanella sairae]|uniref:Sialic acid synthase n=1 Tax=Shewanella sairae TaxID=190310 RepID=A0ABQ4PQ99_9GAMM|nr:pseudaminic acid synthase [Shewanella sairae]MCL1129276.1 pseudaminic acid synthase [Shewanella sairae]GIU51254.1 sialic acid synthase [Shewanella sairae]
MQHIKILSHRIGTEEVPFVIAELSGNHGQSLDTAMEMIKAAAATGVQAIKLQTYTADTMTLDVNHGEFMINDDANLWRGESLHSLYQKAMTPWEWHKPLFDYAKSLGLVAFSSPFDVTAVEFLETLDVPCYKVASFENTDHQLLTAVARTGKPVIMSTGMATEAELTESVELLRREGCEQLILLKCTSHYPADPVDANLMTIPDLAQRFNCQSGLSDHTLGIGVSIAAVALGASVLEKHFVLDRTLGGVDADFSMEPDEFAILVQESRRAHIALGKVSYGPVGQERESVKFRRSLYVSQDMRQGEVFSSHNIRSVRPGLGLAPKHMAEFIGQSAKYDINAGTALNWDMLAK